MLRLGNYFNIEESNKTTSLQVQGLRVDISPMSFYWNVTLTIPDTVRNFSIKLESTYKPTGMDMQTITEYIFRTPDGQYKTLHGGYVLEVGSVHTTDGVTHITYTSFKSLPVYSVIASIS